MCIVKLWKTNTFDEQLLDYFNARGMGSFVLNMGILNIHLDDYERLWEGDGTYYI